MQEIKTQHEFGWLPRKVNHQQDNQEYEKHLRAAEPSPWRSLFRDLVADAICERRAKLPRRHHKETGGRYVRD